MKNSIKKILVAAVLCCILTAVPVKASLEKETAGPARYPRQQMEEVSYLQEGYVEEIDGVHAEVAWCQNGDRKIFGKFYYPEAYDQWETYPVVVMSHGFGSRYDVYEKRKWVKLLTEAGYICYAFDFCGGSESSFSDMDFQDMSVLTEVEDLEAVTDFVQEKRFCDEKKLFYMGASQGGLVCAIEAARRDGEIAGMILLYPGFCLPEIVEAACPDPKAVQGDTVTVMKREVGLRYVTDALSLDVMEEITGYTKDVLILHGIEDTLVPYEGSLEALEGPYRDSDSELVLITGSKAKHGFDGYETSGTEYAREAVLDFMIRHLE